MRKILLVGAQGMLAHDFISLYKKVYDLHLVDKEEMDVSSLSNVEKTIKKVNPSLVLNFSAYTNVEKAESIDRKINYEVNAIGVYNLAKICAENESDLITLSTDYVFDGIASQGYCEKDIPNPINQYGMAKYIGEQLCLKEHPRAIIIRTSWLYGWWKDYKNFVNTIIRLSNEKESLKIVRDQKWNPTFTYDLSKAIDEIIRHIHMHRWKTFHLTNDTSGVGVSWYDFATEILTLLNKKNLIIPVTSEEFPTVAKRPSYSMLCNSSHIALRNRKEALKDYIESLFFK